MSLFNFKVVPNNLLGSTSNLINQPSSQNKLSNNVPYTSSQPLLLQGEMDYTLLSGGKKEKKKPKSKPTPKKEKKVKLIDTFLKSDLEKIAKKHDIPLKGRDGKLKTKEQLFSSLKRKKLIK
jgi:hypothetical protein